MLFIMVKGGLKSQIVIQRNSKQGSLKNFIKIFKIYNTLAD